MKESLVMIMLGVLISASACTDLTKIESSDIKEKIVIAATQEQYSSTKTVLQDDGSVWWKPNDAIGVFLSDQMTMFYSYNFVDAPSANFIGEVDEILEEKDTYWAVFPPDLTNVYTKDKNFNYRKGNNDYETPSLGSGSVNVYLPARQKGVPGTFDSNYFISIAKSEDYKEFSFYNLCGGLAFCVEREGIYEVTFSANAEEELAGLANVVMNLEGRPVARYVRNGKSEVTLAMNKGEYFVPGEWYYIVMFPTILEKGYTMTFTANDEKGTLISNEPVEIKRSVFGRLENPDKRAQYVEKDPPVIYDIKIDGDFSDWGALDISKISVATCDPDARWTALKTLKAVCDSENLYVYFEFESDEIADREWVPLHVFINQDNNTEGCGDDQWIGQAGQEYMMEGAVFMDGEFSSYDPALFQYFGTDLSTVEWAWEIVIPEGSGIATGAGSGNAYELSISLGSLDNANVQLSDIFAIGVDIQQSWNSVGVLPNAAITDDNPRGAAPMHEVRMY